MVLNYFLDTKHQAETSLHCNALSTGLLVSGLEVSAYDGLTYGLKNGPKIHISYSMVVGY